MSPRDLLKKYETEINKHQFDLVRPLISVDCTFWFTSGTYVGLDQAQAAFENTWTKIREEIYSLSDIVWIAESRKAAVCIYTYSWQGLIDGKPSAGRGRGTSCFREEADGWKIVHEHLSGFPK